MQTDACWYVSCILWVRDPSIRRKVDFVQFHCLIHIIVLSANTQHRCCPPFFTSRPELKWHYYPFLLETDKDTVLLIKTFQKCRSHSLILMTLWGHVWFSGNCDDSCLTSSSASRLSAAICPDVSAVIVDMWMLFICLWSDLSYVYGYKGYLLWYCASLYNLLRTWTSVDSSSASGMCHKAPGTFLWGSLDTSSWDH